MLRVLFSGLIGEVSALNSQVIFPSAISKAQRLLIVCHFDNGVTAGKVDCQVSFDSNFSFFFTAAEFNGDTENTRVAQENGITFSPPFMRARVTDALVGGSARVYAHILG